MRFQKSTELSVYFILIYIHLFICHYLFLVGKISGVGAILELNHGVSLSFTVGFLKEELLRKSEVVVFHYLNVYLFFFYLRNMIVDISFLLKYKLKTSKSMIEFS